jgi:hypothetical protein
MTGMIKGIVALAMMEAAVVGCSSSGGGSDSTIASSALPAASTSNPPYYADHGEDAASIASHISGCRGVRAGSVGDGRRTGMTSTASCSLAGHVVIIDSYKPGIDATVDDAVVRHKVYYALGGETWTAILADPGFPPSRTILQMQLTNDTRDLTRMEIGSIPVPHPATLDAQRRVLSDVAAALGGLLKSAS